MQTVTFPGNRQFSICALLEGPTPIRKLERLSSRYGVGLFVKRDDLTGLGMGGNKLRKLEFLLGEAVAEGADTVITVGARQSNHARLTAAAAARLGLHCELVLNHAVPRTDDDYEHNGNVLLNGLLGAVVHHLPGASDTMAFALARADELRRGGRRVVVCPLGGSSALGCLGYVRCAMEIDEQEREAGIVFDEIVLPNGSGGTQAGLVAGQRLLGRPLHRIRAHAVLAGLAPTRDGTRAKTKEVLRLLGLETGVEADELVVSGAALGPGYGLPTPGMKVAVRTLAMAEGLFIDPVYGGKAFAGLLADLEEGRYEKGRNVMFLMTGGLAGLFAYRSTFIDA